MQLIEPAQRKLNREIGGATPDHPLAIRPMHCPYDVHSVATERTVGMWTLASGVEGEEWYRIMPVIVSSLIPTRAVWESKHPTLRECQQWHMMMILMMMMRHAVAVGHWGSKTMSRIYITEWQGV